MNEVSSKVKRKSASLRENPSVGEGFPLEITVTTGFAENMTAWNKSVYLQRRKQG
jgi:hypothetical protein